MDRKWLWVAIGMVALALLVCGGFIGTSVYMALRHLEVKQASVEDAEREIDSVRSKLPNQQALVELEEGDLHRIVVHRPPENADVKPVTTLHIMATEPGEEKLVRLQLPLWLLRLSPGQGTLSVHQGSLSFEDMKLTVDDIERHGPGLIIDYRGRRGERVLVWSE